jgi:hypothetical protein
MAPRKRSSFELKASCARAGRIRQREKEEHLLLSRRGVTEFLLGVRCEIETFEARIIPGEPLARMLDGGVFGWDENHPLTDARNLCRKIVADENQTEESKAECVVFLAALDDGFTRDHFIDPVACENGQMALDTFCDDDFTCWYWTVFRMADLCGSKHANGERLYTRSEMSFADGVAEVLDRTNEALRAANLPFLR